VNSDPQAAVLSVRDVADRLGITERWVRQFISDGELRATKIRQWRISEADLTTFLVRRENRVACDMRNQVDRFVEAEPGDVADGAETLVIFDLPIDDARTHATRSTEIVNRYPSLTWTFRTNDDGTVARHVLSGPDHDISEATRSIQRAVLRKSTT
jgi:excisionase family DNA binding protein